MKKVIFTIAVLFFIVFSNGCNLYEGKNIDPDAPTAVNPDGLLKGIQLADIEVQLGQSQRIAGMWTGQYRGVILLYLAIHEYNLSAEESNNTWNLAYQSVVKHRQNSGDTVDPFKPETDIHEHSAQGR